MMKITGVIETGAGKGSFFVGLDWVVSQLEKQLGFKPFAGTLNVRLNETDLAEAESFFGKKDFDLIPEDPTFCRAGVKRVNINGLPAAAVFPSEDVRIHGDRVIEIIAGCHIKDTLNLQDGDVVTIGGQDGEAEMHVRSPYEPRPGPSPGRRMNAHSRIVWHDRRLDGVIFDLDGTLTDSIEVYYQVFRKAAAVQLGIRVEQEDLFGPLAEGSDPWDDVFPQDLPDRRQTIKGFRRALLPAFLEALQRVRPLPGVPEVLETLYRKEIRLGLVTDSFSSSLEPLRSAGLIQYFGATVTRDDGYPRKPEPEGLLECLSRMGVAAAHAVIVGDTLMDITAGQRAGTLTIGVLGGLASREQFETVNPTALVDDLAGVLEVFNLKTRTHKALRR